MIIKMNFSKTLKGIGNDGIEIFMNNLRRASLQIFISISEECFVATVRDVRINDFAYKLSIFNCF